MKGFRKQFRYQIILIGFITFCLFVSFIVVDILSFKNQEKVENQLSQFSDIGHKIQLYDEKLTNSAMMMSLTGKPEWKHIHIKYEKLLEETLDEALKIDQTGAIQKDILAIKTSNNSLIKLEKQAFELSERGTIAQAYRILSGKEYQKYKNNYNKSSNLLREKILKTKDEISLQSLKKDYILIAVEAILFAFILIIWIRLYQIYVKKLAHNQMSVKEDRAKLRLFFEQSIFGYALCDMNGNILETNRKYNEITGYDFEELQKITYWDLTPKKYSENEDTQLESLNSTGSYGPYRKEYIRKDGSLIPVELNGFIVENSLGERGIWSIVEDLSEKSRLEQEKFEALEANEAKTRFLANISHELRTPMHGVLSFAELGIEQVSFESRDVLADYFGEIYSTGKRLLGLVDDLLDLSKLNAEKMEYKFESHDLARAIETVVRSLNAALKKKNLQISFKNISSLELCFDLDRISQVLLNLLSNAIKFSHSGTVIKIKMSHLNDCDVIVSISNRGIPIPISDVKKIFEPFSQSSNTLSNAGGTGLGLPICKKIISDHGGSIWVNATEDLTDFKFILKGGLHDKKIA